MGLRRVLLEILGGLVTLFALGAGAVAFTLLAPRVGDFLEQLPAAVVLTGGALAILGGSFVAVRLHRALEAWRIARADVSSAWQRQAGRRLEVNLTELSLNGTRLGDGIQGLSFLGPAEVNKAAPEGILEYPSRGLGLEMSWGKLIAFNVELAPASEDDPRPVLFCGRDGSKQLGQSSTEADITAALGAPYCRYESQGMVYLYFERRDGKRWVELLLELDKTGRLGFCAVTREPDLADPYWREHRQVTADWPPERETGLGEGAPAGRLSSR